MQLGRTGLPVVVSPEVKFTLHHHIAASCASLSYGTILLSRSHDPLMRCMMLNKLSL